jgi:polysaccharide deacetylase 2 family uncharacterized protein YibQ
VSEPKRPHRPLPRRDPRGPRPPFRVLAITLGLPLAAFLAFVLYQWWAGAGGVESAPPAPKNEARSIPRKAAVKPAPSATPAEPPSPAAKRGTIALILDDVGYDRDAARRAANLGVPLTFAVIPGTPHAAETAKYLAGRGYQVLCHLPMEPEGYPEVSPGEGAILQSMTDEEIRRRTVAMVRSIPHAAGVNNHMGSAATTDPRVMASVLGALRDEGVFFVDSKTTPRSVAAGIARDLGVPNGERSVFLDDDESVAAVRRQLGKLAASANGTTAIGIGHLYPSTLRVLEEELPRLRARGYTFVTAGAAVR